MSLQRRLFLGAGLRIDPERLSLLFLLAALLMLLVVAAPGAQAQGQCVVNSAGLFFRMSGGYAKGHVTLYGNSSCAPPVYGGFSTGKYGIVGDWEPQAAIRSCIRHTGKENMRVSPFGAFYWSCEPINDYDSGDGAHGYSSYRASKLPLDSIKITAELGLNSGIQFERYDHYAVGVQSVVDRGILDVVDVWGLASQNYEVCFPQPGAIVFVDSATSPRKVVQLESYARDDYTCGAMNRAGQIVLVKGSSASASNNDALAQAFIDATNDEASSAIDLDNCSVFSAHNLNLRDDPWGKIITVVPKNASVPASARTESWYRVGFTEAAAKTDDAETSVTHEGWIAVWLSEGDGDCDWQSDDTDSPALASIEITPPEEEHSIASLARDAGL